MITYSRFVYRVFGDMFSQLQLLRVVSVFQLVDYCKVKCSEGTTTKNATDLHEAKRTFFFF